jgi:hypothetical protein
MWTNHTEVTFDEFFANEKACLDDRTGAVSDVPCRDLGVHLPNIEYDGERDIGAWDTDSNEWKAYMLYGFMRHGLGGEGGPIVSLAEPPPYACDGRFYLKGRDIDLCKSHSDLVWAYGIDAALDITCAAPIAETHALLHRTNELKRTEWFPFAGHVQGFCKTDALMNIFVITFISIIGFLVLGFVAVCGKETDRRSRRAISRGLGTRPYRPATASPRPRGRPPSL